MIQIDYNTMSKEELKQYFLKHRGNKAALRAYVERINRKSLRIIARLGDRDFDEKVREAIRQKLEKNSDRQKQKQ